MTETKKDTVKKEIKKETKKTTPKKTAKVEQKTKPVEEKVVVEKKERVKKPMRKKRIQIDRDTEVVITNLTSGTFIYVDPKTQNRYVLPNFGDEDYITIDELLTMRNRNRTFLENMWVAIVDVLDDEYTVDDVIKFLRLETAYSDGFEAHSIDEFIKTSTMEQFEKVVSHTSTGLVKRISERAVELFRNKEYQDRNKMSIIERYLDNNDLINDIVGE